MVYVITVLATIAFIFLILHIAVIAITKTIEEDVETPVDDPRLIWVAGVSACFVLVVVIVGFLHLYSSVKA